MATSPPNYFSSLTNSQYATPVQSTRQHYAGGGGVNYQHTTNKENSCCESKMMTPSAVVTQSVVLSPLYQSQVPHAALPPMSSSST